MRTLKALAVAAAVLVALAAPAAAHVTVQPPEAKQGGYAKLAFRVPNERDDAATTKLEVQIPADAALRSVSVKPLPGWTATVTDTAITWTGGRIEPGQFQEFEVSVGPLPELDQLVFKAVQTYDSGEEVGWIDEDPDAEHPAPKLTLLEAAEGAGAHGATTTTELEVAPVSNATGPAVEASDGSDTVAGIAVGLSLVAVLVSIGSFVSVRRRSAA